MRGTGLTIVALGLGAMSVSSGLAQSKPQFKHLNVPRYDLSVGYNNVRGNAPPGGCNCFNMNGGFVSGAVHLSNWIAIAGEFTGGSSDRISPLGQGLTLTTFTGGPRITYVWGRFIPFGEVLVGGAHGSNSYFPSSSSVSSSATSFALSSGGGLDIKLNKRFSVRALDVQYLRTSFPNAVNNEQNQLMIGAGIVFNFEGRPSHPKVQPAQVPPPAPPPAPTVVLSCSTNAANVRVGEMVVVTGDARTQPASLDVTYSWASDGATVEGTGNTVSINTTGMAVGDYRVTGHATLASTPTATAECAAVFRVVAVPPPAPAETYVTVVDTAKTEKEFHDNVKDAYFDLNSAKIRPETLASIIHAAQYLVAHPQIHVIISGWTDPRGSMKFNLALGMKRATAVRNSLINAGVPESQTEIISNGKSSQVCTTEDQMCYQQNRRVSFSMKP
jgi:outer membrane protein OmpA-like peptidoglycan-associated protein